MPEERFSPQSSQAPDAVPSPRPGWTPPRLERLDLDESGLQPVKAMIGVEHDNYRPS